MTKDFAVVMAALTVLAGVLSAATGDLAPVLGAACAWVPTVGLVALLEAWDR